MKKGIVILCAVSVLFATCTKPTDDTTDYSLLYGDTYILKIDKVSNLPDVQFPGDNLQDIDYQSTDEDIRYTITFSEKGQRINIEPASVGGEKIITNEEKLYYELDEGLFAGGRFIIWISNDEFNAEYTIYGSGVPIVKSERGVLKK